MGMPQSTLLIHPLMSSYLFSQDTLFEFSHLRTLLVDSLIYSLNKDRQYNGEHSVLDSESPAQGHALVIILSSPPTPGLGCPVGMPSGQRSEAGHSWHEKQPIEQRQRVKGQGWGAGRQPDDKGP